MSSTTSNGPTTQSGGTRPSDTKPHHIRGKNHQSLNRPHKTSRRSKAASAKGIRSFGNGVICSREVISNNRTATKAKMMFGVLKSKFRSAPVKQSAEGSSDRNFALHSGERQTATTYDGTRIDHRNRYEWAETHLPVCGCGLDIFCGNGYGTWKLSETRSVIGYDASNEAIDFAKAHFQRGGAIFLQGLYPFDIPEGCFDFVVSFESVGYVEGGQAFFKALAASLKPGGRFVFSVPCEDVLPLKITGNAFHFKHYTLPEIEQMMEENTLKLVDWAGQNTYQIENGSITGELPSDMCFLKSNSLARFIIFAAEKVWQF